MESEKPESSRLRIIRSIQQVSDVGLKQVWMWLKTENAGSFIGLKTSSLVSDWLFPTTNGYTDIFFIVKFNPKLFQENRVEFFSVILITHTRSKARTQHVHSSKSEENKLQVFNYDRNLLKILPSVQ